MVIRKIRKSDYASVDALLMQLHGLDVSRRPDRFSPADHYMSASAFENLVKNENILTFLAQQGKNVVGCCFASVFEGNGKTEKSVYIDLLVVDEPYQRRGIGRTLFREVQAKAKKLGANRVELIVWSHNPGAECAYRAYGMRPQRTIYEIDV